MRLLTIVFWAAVAGQLLAGQALAQEDDFGEEVIRYYQMETMDDSLFIRIQEEMKIDPPNPKVEIVIDLRDPQNQTVTIQNTVYPFLAFSPETRARIMTFPFKLNLEEQTTYTSVFTRVVKKIKLRNLVMPPRRSQILSTRAYVNPYLQLFGGERFGFPLKQDIGFSLGFGTPYSGPMESDLLELNFHILGCYLGYLTGVPSMTGQRVENQTLSDSGGGFAINQSNRMHLMHAVASYQIGYVFPLGNFFEVNYQITKAEFTAPEISEIMRDTAGGYAPQYMTGSYFNWEFRYPMRNLGSTRSKLYLASYQRELHLGFTGRELALVGSNFDLRLDATIPYGRVRRSGQFMMECLVSKIGEGWASGAVAMGPALIVGMSESHKIRVNTVLFNIRLKLGSSF